MAGETSKSVVSRTNGNDSDWYCSEEDVQNLEYLDASGPEKSRLHEILLEDPLSQLNAAKPIVMNSDDTVLKAVRLMKQLRYGSVLVVDGDDLVGIFTEKDLLVKASGPEVDIGEVKLAEVMTTNPQGLEEDDTIAHALNLMSIGGYRHVPILKEGRPARFVSIRGILRYITDNALQS